MTDKEESRGRPHLRLVATVKPEATAFADRLEADYRRAIAQPNCASDNICVDVNDYPADHVVDEAVIILKERGLHAEPNPFNCAGTRAGVVWVSKLGYHSALTQAR